MEEMMRKLLYTTTALTALAATSATAQMMDDMDDSGVSLSGSGRLGIVYDGSKEGANQEKTKIEKRFTINIDGKGSTDVGLDYGGHIRLRSDENDADNKSNTSGANVWLGNDMSRITVGNTDGAIVNQVDFYHGSVGLTGLHWANLGMNMGDQEWVLTEFQPQAASFDGNTVRLDFNAGGFGVSLSADSTGDHMGDDAQQSIGASYTLGDWTFAAGFATNVQVHEHTARLTLARAGDATDTAAGALWAGRGAGSFGKAVIGKAYEMAKTARDEAQTARDEAQTARDEAQTARDEAQTARDEAQTAVQEQVHEAKDNRHYRGRLFERLRAYYAADRAYHSNGNDKIKVVESRIAEAQGEVDTAESSDELKMAQDELKMLQEDLETARAQFKARNDALIAVKEPQLYFLPDTAEEGQTESPKAMLEKLYTSFEERQEAYVTAQTAVDNADEDADLEKLIAARDTAQMELDKARTALKGKEAVEASGETPAAPGTGWKAIDKALTDVNAASTAERDAERKADSIERDQENPDSELNAGVKDANAGVKDAEEKLANAEGKLADTEGKLADAEGKLADAEEADPIAAKGGDGTEEELNEARMAAEKEYGAIVDKDEDKKLFKTPVDAFALSVTGSFGDFGLGASYTDYESVGNKAVLSASYDVSDATTVTAFVSQLREDRKATTGPNAPLAAPAVGTTKVGDTVTVPNSRVGSAGLQVGDSKTEYGIGFTHSLGGATLAGGVSRNYKKDIMADLGVRFTF